MIVAVLGKRIRKKRTTKINVTNVELFMTHVTWMPCRMERFFVNFVGLRIVSIVDHVINSVRFMNQVVGYVMNVEIVIVENVKLVKNVM
jgi:hypothetical protein